MSEVIAVKAWIFLRDFSTIGLMLDSCVGAGFLIVELTFVACVGTVELTFDVFVGADFSFKAD